MYTAQYRDGLKVRMPEAFPFFGLELYRICLYLLYTHTFPSFLNLQLCKNTSGVRPSTPRVEDGAGSSAAFRCEISLC